LAMDEILDGKRVIDESYKELSDKVRLSPKKANPVFNIYATTGELEAGRIKEVE